MDDVRPGTKPRQPSKKSHTNAADEPKLLDSLTVADGSCNASTVPLVNYSFKVNVTKLFFDGERADARGADLIWALYNLLSFVGARTRAVRLRLDEGVEEIRRCHDTYLSDHKQWLKDGKITEWVVDDGLNFHSRPRRLWRGARRRALSLCGALAGLSSLSGRPQSASAQVCAPGAASVLATVQRLASGPVRELGTAHEAAVPVRVRHVRVGVWRGRHAPWHVSPSAFAASSFRYAVYH